ncbi:Uncharacterised protein [Porphyromonas macacae]|uniref:N-acyl amino acid synthase FeeM catalytic core domain-containing protein n=1 Tax=Porphyromonas macacae TaxID=28115 RepID=A0A379DGC4_9PORP|nr:hypothetical protein [Porphyromonas macacae]SUB77047.1 Uncharacterised protein [Porphyromonas macacae]
MDRFITKFEEITLWQLSKESLFSLAKFVVDENYIHHQKVGDNKETYVEEYQMIFTEESIFFDYSSIVVAKDNAGSIVGSIRVMNWNLNPNTIPLMKLFGENLINKIKLKEEYEHIWHVGRFAVQKAYKDKVKLFKLLMLYAISPVFRHDRGVLLAEADEKLLRVMRAMKIDVQLLSEGKEYIGSKTIPMMVTKNGLSEFMLNNVAMAFDLRFDVEKTQLPERVKFKSRMQNYPFGYCDAIEAYRNSQVYKDNSIYQEYNDI